MPQMESVSFDEPQHVLYRRKRNFSEVEKNIVTENDVQMRQLAQKQMCADLTLDGFVFNFFIGFSLNTVNFLDILLPSLHYFI